MLTKTQVKVSLMAKFDAVKSRVHSVAQDTGYAVKVFSSVLSGYKGLQYRGGDWYNVPDGELPDNPFYVCALFENGRHIPLPLILGTGKDCGRLQAGALKFVERRTGRGNRGLWRAFYRALYECAWYEHDWAMENPCAFVAQTL